MALRDYVHLTANESIREPTDLTVSDRQAAEAGLGDFPLEEVPRDVLEKALELKSRAVSGAPVATGKFPLLVIVPGNHDPAWRHFVLAEFLASHGYVVAAFPSASRRVRDAMTMDFGFGPFRDQMADAGYVTNYMRAEYPAVDPSRVMLFGFSIGGNTGGFNLLRNPAIQGFVCLDCGIGSTWGTPLLNGSLQRDYPAAQSRPLAFIHISEGGERNDDSFIDSFENAYAYHAIIPGARHFNFTSLGAIAAEIPEINHDRWLASGPAARRIHDQSLQRVQQFLDAHLKNDEAARRLLSRNTGNVSILAFDRVVAPE